MKYTEVIDFDTFKTQAHYGCDRVVIKGNKKLAKEWLEDLWLNDKNNAIIDYYLTFRNDQISVAQKITKGRANGVVYVINLDDCFVLETNEDFFYFSQNDDEWLEEVSNVSCNEIAEWLKEREINYIMEED